MNDALQKGREKYLEKVRNGQIVKAEQLDPVEKARRNPTSLRSAINAKCYDCCGNQRIEVSLCTVVDCPLWNLRPWQKKSER